MAPSKTDSPWAGRLNSSVSAHRQFQGNSMNKIDWKAFDAADIELSKKNYAGLAKKGSVNRDFFGAALFALEQAERQQLLPQRNEDLEMRYTADQAVTAACFARQDVVATLVIQQAILRRLQGLKLIGYACIALLAFIAYRLA